MISVSTTVERGKPRYTSVWKKPGVGTGWYSTHGLSKSNYQGETSNWYHQGYRPVFASAFMQNGVPRFNAIWHRNGGMTPGNLETVNSAIQTYMQNNNVPGLSLAISQQGRLVYAKGFGQADQSADEWVHPNHRFRVASVSKPITAAAILKLRDHCGLDLDQTVFGDNGILGNSYGSSDYSNREEAITVRHLLQHTTGWTIDGISQVSSSDPRDVLDWQLDFTEPASAPGSEYDYMNADFCVAGRVIERISGKTYEQFVNDELLAPSCISTMEIGGNTLFERKQGEVVYYDDSFDPYGLNLRRMDANGGWIARPIDLLLLLRRMDGASDQADLLSLDSVTQMLTGSTPQTGYGLGMVTANSAGPIGNNQWGHNGGMQGTIAFMIYRNDGIAFAFACNTRPVNDQFAGSLRSVVDGIINTLNSANAWPVYDLFPCNVPAGDPPPGLAAPRAIYVDGESSCLIPNGQKACSLFGGPFRSVQQALDVVCNGDTLFIRAGSYEESVIFNKFMTVRSYDGVANIGQ